MALFLDTSSLVKLFVQEQASADVERAVAADLDLHVGCLTAHEFLSALQRKMRSNMLSPPEVVAIRAEFERMMASVSVVPFTETLSRRGMDLLGQYGREGLRTLDAIQLACLQEVPGGRLATSDQTLAAIAEKSGFRVDRYL